MVVAILKITAITIIAKIAASNLIMAEEINSPSKKRALTLVQLAVSTGQFKIMKTISINRFCLHLKIEEVEA